MPELLALGPERGGVGDSFAHTANDLIASGAWRVEVERVEEGEAPFRRALAVLMRRRRSLAGADAIHVEFGSNDTTLFWLALLVTARRRAVAIVVHDYPLLAHHPAAGLLSRSRRWNVIVGHRLLSPLLDRFVKRLVLRRAGAVVVMSEAAAAGWRRHVRGELIVIPHGTFPVSDQLIAPSRGRYLLFAGFIGPAKGLDVLLAAWERVSARSPLPLIVAGSSGRADDPDLERMKAASARCGRPPEWVGYVGSERELQRLIGGAAAVVLPYRRSNPTSGILARAMLEGRAIVATRVPATVSAIRDRIDGLLVAADDPGELAAALDEVLCDPGLRDRLGASARERASELFSSARRQALLVNAYERCRSLERVRPR